MAAAPDPELVARLGEVMPTGDWVEAMADEEAARARLDSLREIAWPDLEIAMIGPGFPVFTGSTGSAKPGTTGASIDRYTVEIEDLVREASMCGARPT